MTLPGGGGGGGGAYVPLVSTGPGGGGGAGIAEKPAFVAMLAGAASAPGALRFLFSPGKGRTSKCRSDSVVS